MRSALGEQGTAWRTAGASSSSSSSSPAGTGTPAAPFASPAPPPPRPAAEFKREQDEPGENRASQILISGGASGRISADDVEPSTSRAHSSSASLPDGYASSVSATSKGEAVEEAGPVEASLPAPSTSGVAPSTRPPPAAPPPAPFFAPPTRQRPLPPPPKQHLPHSLPSTSGTQNHKLTHNVQLPGPSCNSGVGKGKGRGSGNKAAAAAIAAAAAEKEEEAAKKFRLTLKLPDKAAARLRRLLIAQPLTLKRLGICSLRLDAAREFVSTSAMAVEQKARQEAALTALPPHPPLPPLQASTHPGSTSTTSHQSAGTFLLPAQQNMSVAAVVQQRQAAEAAQRMHQERILQNGEAQIRVAGVQGGIPAGMAPPAQPQPMALHQSSAGPHQMMAGHPGAPRQTPPHLHPGTPHQQPSHLHPGAPPHQTPPHLLAVGPHQTPPHMLPGASHQTPPHLLHHPQMHQQQPSGSASYGPPPQEAAHPSMQPSAPPQQQPPSAIPPHLQPSRPPAPNNSPLLVNLLSSQQPPPQQQPSQQARAYSPYGTGVAPGFPQQMQGQPPPHMDQQQMAAYHHQQMQAEQQRRMFMQQQQQAANMQQAASNQVQTPTTSVAQMPPYYTQQQQPAGGGGGVRPMFQGGQPGPSHQGVYTPGTRLSYPTAPQQLQPVYRPVQEEAPAGPPPAKKRKKPTKKQLQQAKEAELLAQQQAAQQQQQQQQPYYPAGPPQQPMPQQGMMHYGPNSAPASQQQPQSAQVPPPTPPGPPTYPAAMANSQQPQQAAYYQQHMWQQHQMRMMQQQQQQQQQPPPHYAVAVTAGQQPIPSQTGGWQHIQQGAARPPPISYPQGQGPSQGGVLPGNRRMSGGGEYSEGAVPNPGPHYPQQPLQHSSPLYRRDSGQVFPYPSTTLPQGSAMPLTPGAASSAGSQQHLVQQPSHSQHPQPENARGNNDFDKLYTGDDIGDLDDLDSIEPMHELGGAGGEAQLGGAGGEAQLQHPPLIDQSQPNIQQPNSQQNSGSNCDPINIEASITSVVDMVAKGGGAVATPSFNPNLMGGSSAQQTAKGASGSGHSQGGGGGGGGGQPRRKNTAASQQQAAAAAAAAAADHDAAIRRQGHTGATSNAAPPMHPVGPAASGHVPTCYSGSCTPSSSHPTTTSTAAAIPQQQLQPPPSPSLSYEHNMRAAAFHGGGQQRMHAARPQRIMEGENGRPSSMINGHEVPNGVRRLQSSEGGAATEVDEQIAEIIARVKATGAQEQKVKQERAAAQAGAKKGAGVRKRRKNDLPKECSPRKEDEETTAYYIQDSGQPTHIVRSVPMGARRPMPGTQMMATPGVGPTTIVSPPPGYGAYHHIPMSGHRPQPQPIFKQTAHLQPKAEP